ncbi:MAG: CBS domain-containing protein [Candidatus Manganitrophaceae bacterium]|nr:MAG: CBS domain-containing protein [Candidatus Manganitrophaceae bacterium]
MVPVKMVMSKKILKVKRGTKIKKVSELMRDKHVGSILVSDGNSYAGIVTDADVVRRVVAEGLDPNTTPVEKVMTSPLLAIESTRSVVDANDIMDQEHIRHLGVIENGKIIGVLSVRDLLRHVYGGWGFV